jgi:hypothetical protein
MKKGKIQAGNSYRWTAYYQINQYQLEKNENYHPIFYNNQR